MIRELPVNLATAPAVGSLAVSAISKAIGLDARFRGHDGFYELESETKSRVIPAQAGIQRPDGD
jgi:hypothetical protein